MFGSQKAARQAHPKTAQSELFARTSLALLDNPIWHALKSAHHSLARTNGAAARYPADVSPFAGLREPSRAAFADLAGLVNSGESVALLSAAPIDVPTGWTVVRAVQIGQMVCEKLFLQAILEPQPLTDADVPDMLSLTAKTEPGPFLPRTNRLGRYYGIRADDGTLAAMAGERLNLGAFIEVSAVCTDPASRGKGLAAGLTTHVTAQIIAEGRTPFLHFHLDNPARHLYEKLGFTFRKLIELTIVTRR